MGRPAPAGPGGGLLRPPCSSSTTGDPEVPFQSGAAIAAAWPGARLVETSGLGHNRVLRDPDSIARVVDFLARDGAGARGVCGGGRGGGGLVGGWVASTCALNARAGDLAHFASPDELAPRHAFPPPAVSLALVHTDRQRDASGPPFWAAGAILLLGPRPASRRSPRAGHTAPIPQIYEVPKGAAHVYYVAPDGRAEAPGTALAQPTSLEAAIERVVTGDAIVMRGGVYRTGGLQLNQGITLQPYARGEQPVLKGTEVATQWEALRGGVWRTSWKRLFPSKPSTSDL